MQWESWQRYFTQGNSERNLASLRNNVNANMKVC